MKDTKKFVNKASEAALAATAFANTSARRLVDTIASAGLSEPHKSSRHDTTSTSSQTYAFLDNMCGPILNNFKSDDNDDLTEGPSHSRRSRRPQGSFDYDDETNMTDVTSYDEEDDTYDGRKKRGGGERRGRDRQSRGRSPHSSDGEDKEDTDTEFSGYPPAPTLKKEKKKSSSTRSSSNHGGSHHQHVKPVEDSDTIHTGMDSSKLLSQPLASGFAKRCYFTKSGIGRTTQHYEGLTLTGNTVLMLASAMKLKGCPTICDEDLRRVEQTYPNQFSRLPDELLLSSGWRRISKYCHFSYKPLPDGVPFFHSRRRCHPNGGFYFLLCSAVGMTRLMDVEPLNRDALAVLQTDFPVPCEKAPRYLMEDVEEWTLVNKFCFFSGGPINVEEDVYYCAELGGKDIYMLAFLSPSLSPEELYRLKPGGKGEESQNLEPLKSVAAVEEIETVYDLTERDFDDLKLYHLGPCRALPPYLLRPQAWTKVLPPHFVAARDQAMIRAMEFEKRFPGVAQSSPSMSRGAQDNRGAMGGGNSEYVELGGRLGHTPASRAPGMTPQGMGPAFTPQYGGMPPSMMQHPGGAMPYHPQQQPMNYGGMPPVETADMSYYYGGNTGAHASLQNGMPPGPSSFMPPQQQQQQQQFSYGNTSLNQSAYSDHPFDATPPRNNIADPRWGSVQDEGAFGMNPVIANDQPDDEALATRGAGAMYSGMNSDNMMMPNDEMNVVAFNYNGMETPVKDPQDVPQEYNNMLASERQQDYKRPDLSSKIGLSTKLGQQHSDDGTWETRTEGDSTYESSAVTGSSVTDTTNPNERNSRRALILQMAKARMKNVKPAADKEKTKNADVNETVAQSQQPESDSLADQAAHLELD